MSGLTGPETFLSGPLCLDVSVRVPILLLFNVGDHSSSLANEVIDLFEGFVSVAESLNRNLSREVQFWRELQIVSGQALRSAFDSG